jgi:aldehyde:ferredoxin oxidoreductase
MQILRVNTRTKSIQSEALSNEWLLYGNRGLIDEILVREVPPNCEPLGRHNKLVFASGPLAVTTISCAQRISAGAKSPLTGGIKEANAGGIASLLLAQHGIRALVIEDKPEEKTSLNILVIGNEQYDFVCGDDYRSLETTATTKALHDRYGNKSAIICIGPAGEMLMSAAGIVVSDMDGNASRHCARGGLGAVMGSKGLKAIVIRNDGTYRVQVKRPDMYREAVREYVNLLRTAPQTSIAYPKYGTPGVLQTINYIGALPSYAFRSGQFDKVEGITGEAVHQLIVKRGGEGTPTHRCMPGCLIQCSNIFPDEEGKQKVASFEFETLALLGSNLGIGDLDTIAELNRLCNEYGLDTIEIGATLGVYMDVGLAEFGDGASAINLVKEIGRGTLIGKILGEGAAITGRVFKSLRVPAVKGQSMAGHEPRSIKGMSVTYATSPMGADHTAGVTSRAKIDHLDPRIQMEVSRNVQVKIATVDTLGLCMFATTAGPEIPSLIVRMLNGLYGTDVNDSLFETLGKAVILMEREFNIKAGISAGADTMPEFMKEEPIPPHNAVSDIPEKHYSEFWDEKFWHSS